VVAGALRVPFAEVLSRLGVPGWARALLMQKSPLEHLDGLPLRHGFHHASVTAAGFDSRALRAAGG